MLLNSLNGQTGDRVTLLSPKMNFSANSFLKFSYHMLLNETDKDGKLTVYRYTLLRTYEWLWSTDGNHGQLWHVAKVCIPAGVYHLAFVGAIGLPSLSDIAIDNIEVSEDRRCNESDSSPSKGIVICKFAYGNMPPVT